MTKVLRALAWMLLVAIAVLSFVPPSFRPPTGTPHNVEHFGIFMLCGMTFGLGYRFAHLRQAIGLAAFAGAIEIAQVWVPGRHPRISDFLVDAISAGVGVLAAWLTLKATRWEDGPRDKPAGI